ncbi:MAG: hypothetical protein ACU0C9_08825 [Paracoccaceae bacterium]
MERQGQLLYSEIVGALLAHSPLDLVLIALGANDCKARFHPTAAGTADNIARLLACVNEIGGGSGPWDEGDVPEIAVVPPPLAATVDRLDF